jgi:hypothetical protein
MGVGIVPWVAFRVVLDVKVPGDGWGVLPKPPSWITISSFEQQHPISCLGKVGGQNPPTWSAPYNDVVVDRAIGRCSLGCGERGVS